MSHAVSLAYGCQVRVALCFCTSSSLCMLNKRLILTALRLISIFDVAVAGWHRRMRHAE